MASDDRNIRAQVRIPDNSLYRTDMYKDTASLTHVVTAEINSRIADALVRQTISQLAERLGVGSETFVDFMRFLTTDPEIRDRYMAHRTARRLWGEL